MLKAMILRSLYANPNTKLLLEQVECRRRGKRGGRNIGVNPIPWLILSNARSIVNKIDALSGYCEWLTCYQNAGLIVMIVRWCDARILKPVSYVVWLWVCLPPQFNSKSNSESKSNSLSQIKGYVTDSINTIDSEWDWVGEWVSQWQSVTDSVTQVTRGLSIQIISIMNQYQLSYQSLTWLSE